MSYNVRIIKNVPSKFSAKIPHNFFSLLFLRLSNDCFLWHISMLNQIPNIVEWELNTKVNPSLVPPLLWFSYVCNRIANGKKNPVLTLKLFWLQNLFGAFLLYFQHSKCNTTTNPTITAIIFFIYGDCSCCFAIVAIDQIINWYS